MAKMQNPWYSQKKGLDHLRIHNLDLNARIKLINPSKLERDNPEKKKQKTDLCRH